MLASVAKSDRTDDAVRQPLYTLLRKWKQVDVAITEGANEAKDNVKYLYTLEKFIEPLYIGDPVTIVDTLPALMNSIKMIHTIARCASVCVCVCVCARACVRHVLFLPGGIALSLSLCAPRSRSYFNTTERMEHLFSTVTSQMINSCKAFILNIQAEETGNTGTRLWEKVNTHSRSAAVLV